MPKTKIDLKTPQLRFDEKLKTMLCGRATPDTGLESEFAQTMNLIPESVDKENRTCEFVAATGEWINRYWWVEKLTISKAAIDTSRLDDGISFCNNHNHAEVHGVSKAYRIDESTGQLIMRVEFSEKKESDEIFQDIIKGIRKYVSIGYIVLEQTITRFEGEEDRPSEYLVTRWLPIELSTVGVPADKDSVARYTKYITDQQSADVKVRNKMPKPVKKTGDADNQTVPAVDTRAIEIKATEAANARASATIADNNAIVDLGLEYGLVKEARQHIQEGKSVQDFQRAVIDHMAEKQRNGESQTSVGMEDKQVREYSLFNAVTAMHEGGIERLMRDCPLEYEASQEVAKRVGRSAQGFFIPAEKQNDFSRIMNPQRAQRDMLVSSATQGGALVGVDHRGGDFIDVLYEKTFLFKLGARILNNLQGDVDIPRGLGGVVPTWVGENVANTPSHALIDSVSLIYKTITASVAMSRKLMKQSDPSVEAYVVDCILQACAIGIDTAGFQGAGGAEILGIMNTAGINTVPVVGTAPNHNESVDFETAIDTDNALTENMAWVVSPSVAGSWKKTLKFAGVGGTIAENGEVNGYPYHRKSGLVAGTALLGNFRDLVFGMWGVLDMMVDKATNVSKGGIILHAFQDVDAVVTQESSFCKNTI